MHTQLFVDLPEAELRAYLRAVHAQPDDDAPRLALAAWLESHGDIRGRMIRGSCGALPDWRSSWEGDILAFWLGTHYPRGIRWDSVRRGLLHVDIIDGHPLIDPAEESNAAFLAAAAQGWIGTARVEGWASDVLALPEPTRSIVLGAYALHLSLRGEVDDAALAGAGRLLNLASVSWEWYDGEECEITDVGLAELLGLRRLRYLDIWGRFSPEMLARLPPLECGPVNLLAEE